MSLTPDFAPDAKSQWQELEPVLQELVVDELDALATNPPAIRVPIVRRDTVHRTETVSHYLFLRFTVDDHKVTLVGIYHHTRPTQSEA